MKTLVVLLAAAAFAQEVEITPATVKAVEENQQWTKAAATPINTGDGRVLYSYGEGLPTVVCTTLMVCVIELQPGEKLNGKPRIGDSVRWEIDPDSYGEGPDATTVLTIKPKALGLDTNVAIYTSRRVYYMRLVSRKDGYMARTGFQFSDSDTKKWAVFAAAQKREEKVQQSDILPAMITAEAMNFNYVITPKKDMPPPHFVPRKVYDDGAKTFIQMPEGIQYRPAPALEILGPDGKSEMTNYRVKANTYIVDRLFDHAQLVLGAGKKGQKVEIARAATAQ